METQNNFPAPGDSNSGANTVLLVIIIVLLVGFGFWWYYHRGARPAEQNNPGINVDVNLPSGNNDNGSNGAPSGGGTQNQ